MTVSVLVPWRPGCPWRERSWLWVQARYAEHHTEWEIVEGNCADGPFNRSEAILDAASRASGDVFVVADSDVWCDPQPAIDNLDGWAIPHTLIHRLSEDSTRQVLAGSDWRGLPLSTDNRQDSRPYRGHETGTLVVLERDLLLDVPPDVRFVGWGQEDDAWSLALRALAGTPWRGTDDIVHLWHPAQPRLTRRVGTEAGEALFKRYSAARRDPARMRSLIEEARCLT